MRRIVLFWVTLFLVSPAEAAIHVVTTMPDYAAIAQEVGGEHVRVKSLASASQDPHFVDAKPSYVLALNQADLVILNGLELEIGWMPILLVQARNPKLTQGLIGYLDVGTIVENILERPVGHLDRSMGDIHAGGNPHYSHDPSRMLKVIDVVASRLSQLEPEHGKYFEYNSKQMKTQLKKVIEAAQADFKALGREARRVVEYHKSFIYLFETLGLEVVDRIEPKPGLSPSPAHVAKVITRMKREKVRVVVQEHYAPRKVSQTVARITKSTHVVLAGGTKFGEGQSYLEHVESNIRSLFEACKAGGA